MAGDDERNGPDDDPKAPGPAGLAPNDPARDILEEDEDAVFQVRMKAVDLFLGYWRHALAFLGVALLAVGAYGFWQDDRLEAQQSVHAEVARVLAKLPSEPSADTDWSSFAADLEAAARAADGPGQAWAAIQAAEMYEMSEAWDEALGAWELADSVGADGMLGWSAAAGRAAALERADRIDEAAAKYRSWTGQQHGVIAEQALFSLATLFRNAGRSDEAVQVFQEMAQRFPESSLAPQVQQALQELQGNG